MARENQGLHVALIILFMVTILLGVTTYIFCRQYIEADESATSLRKELNDKSAANTKIQGDYNGLKRLVLGTDDAAEKDSEDLSAQHKADMETFAGTLEPVQQFYRPALEQMYNLANQRGGELTDANDALQKLQDEYDAWKQQMTAQLAKAEAGRKAAEGKLAAANTAYQTVLAEIRAANDKFKAEQDTTREEIDARLKTLETERDDALTSAKTYRTQRDQLRGELEGIRKPTIDVPDGEIRSVDQRMGVVWINLGRADSLRRQTTFSVYPKDITNLAKAVKKASIEVTRIRGEHLAEAQIVEDAASDPIMTGDKIFTPAWSPGEQIGFALLGRMDVDGDGKGDMRAAKELIELSGGRVDYWRDEKGNESGDLNTQMTIYTRYLVVDSEALVVEPGEAGEGADGERAKAAQAEAERYSDVIQKARELGLENITLGELLQQMGWKRQTRLVLFGREADPRDFQPKPASGVPRVSTGTVSDLFQPRPGPAGQPTRRGGAY